MSFTNQTTNYGLPQWIGTDKPTYLVDQNGAYQTIDTELYNANSNAATALSSASSAVEVAGTAATNAQTAIDSAVTANTNANSAVATANTAITNAAAATATANSALNKVEEGKSTLIDTHTYTSTTYQDMLNTVGTAIANAISEYPIADYEYTLVMNLPDEDLFYNLSKYVHSTNVMYGMITVTQYAINMIAIHLSGSTSHCSVMNFNTSTITSIDSDTISSATTKVYVRKR